METPDLDAFSAEVMKIEDNKFFRITSVTENGVPGVGILKRDEHYFPLTEFVRDRGESSGWKVTRL